MKKNRKKWIPSVREQNFSFSGNLFMLFVNENFLFVAPTLIVDGFFTNIASDNVLGEVVKGENSFPPTPLIRVVF